MTPARIIPRPLLARIVALLLTTTLGPGLSSTATAQDNNPEDCAANEKNEADHCAQQKAPTAEIPAQSLDWVPLEEVPTALIDRQCINCEGRYIDPLAGKKTDIPPEDSDINAHADTSQLREGEVILLGNVKAEQGYRLMDGDKVVINREEESATISGNVVLREPGVLLRSDSAIIYSETDEVVIEDGQFVFHREHMRGTADILKRDTEGLIHIHNGVFTYCEPGANDWEVLSDDMEVDLDEGLITAHQATVELKGVPVFYTPWLRLPLDDRRRTGLLWPDFGTDSSGGLDISVPIYLNLAPNYDALYAPRFIEERGLDHQMQFRYMNPLVGNWFAGGAYLSNDKSYRDKEPNDSANRWLAVLRQDGLFKQRWRSLIDYSKASDVDYMKDLETANIDSLRETSLLQLASMDYLGDDWLMKLQTQKFQSLADDISNQYEKLPQFTSRYRSSGTPFKLQPVALAQYSNFDAKRDVVKGQRLYGEAGLTYPMLWRFGSLKPTLKYRQVNYELTNRQRVSDDDPAAGSGLASFDGKLIFERQTSFGNTGFLQTLEPRLYYLYSEYEDQTDQPVFDSAELTFTYYQLFRDTRFSGHDRLDDANQISAGLTSRLIDDSTGRSLLSASIGQIFYFEDRQVRRGINALPLDDPSSEIAGELLAAPTENLGLRTSLVWDPHDNEVDSGFFEANYEPGNGRIFNLGYAYRQPTNNGFFNQPLTNEARASTYLPLGNNWSIFGAINYSLEDNISVEDMVGVEYDTCCWKVRLVQLRYYNNVSGVTPDFSNPDLERENTIQFQFVLKGMGGLGNRITNIMQDMIRGFEESEY